MLTEDVPLLSGDEVLPLKQIKFVTIRSAQLAHHLTGSELPVHAI
jgi:hypothetical protein